MNANWKRAMLTSLILIFSSLSGCLGDALDNDDSGTEGSYGVVMVSTYHIGELVKGIAGDQVTMEYMSQANIPVHDYEPSASDLIRLQNADVFFYHGLGLEPWVDATLSSLGEDAPTAIQVHTMPSGEATLDYEGVLVTDLCELLEEGPYETIELADEEEHADEVEIHPEYTAFNMTFHHDDHDGEEHDDHDDHDGEEHDDHDDHDGEEHDDHDGHDGHAHIDKEEAIENPEGCPTDSMISIFHLEEGEYMIEVAGDDSEDFTMAVLKMGGGHAHHDHDGHDEDDGHEDHDEEHDEEHGVCHDISDHSNKDIDNEEECEAAGHMWMEEDDHDDHEGDYCHDTVSHANTNHTSEEECEAAGHMWVEEEGHHEEEMTAEHMLEEFDSNNDSHLSWDEFWGAMEGDHVGHHDGNETHEENETHEGNETHEENETHEGHEEELFMWMFNHSDMNGDGLLNMTELEHLIDSMDNVGATPEEALIIADTNDDDHLTWDEFWTAWLESEEDEEGHHDGHEGEHADMVCYDMSTHTVNNSYTNQTDCETAGLMWTAATSGPGTGHGEEDHDAHEEEVLMEMFNESDMDDDGMLNMSELEHFIEEVDAWENPPMGYVMLHIDAEGEYGFAHPADLEFNLLMAEGGHEGHDDHAGHDDHDEDGHDEDEEDHDDHDEEGHDEDEESLNYDPHSWLNPLAFNAQLTVVLEGLTTAFPDGEATFASNAAIYSAQLVAIDTAFDAAFGEDGLCEAGGHQKMVATNHNAYSYIAVEYDIKFTTVHGIDPEGEPSPEDVAKVIEFIKEEGITVLFVEEYTDQSSVQSIVDETGVDIKILYTMETAPSDADEDYISTMTKNLENLVTGIGC